MSAAPINQTTPFHKLLEQLRQEHDREVSELKKQSAQQDNISTTKQTLKSAQDVSKAGAAARSKFRKCTPAFSPSTVAAVNDMSEAEDEDEEETAVQKTRAGTPPRRRNSPPPSTCLSKEAEDEGKKTDSRSAWGSGEKVGSADKLISDYIEEIALDSQPPDTSRTPKSSQPPHSLSAAADDKNLVLSPVLPVEKPVVPSAPEKVLAPAPQGASPIILRMQAMTRAAVRAKHEGTLDLGERQSLPGSPESPSSPSRPSKSCLKSSLKEEASDKPPRLLRSVSFDSVMDDSHTNLKQKHENFKLKKEWHVVAVDSADKPPQKTESFRVSVIQENKMKRNTHSKHSEIDECMQINDPFIADPNALQNFAWALSGTFLVLMDFVFIPMQVFHEDRQADIYVLSIGSSIFWTLDVIRSFFVGYHDKGILVMSAKHIRRHYIRTWAVFDIMLAVCNWLHFVMVCASVSSRIVTQVEAFRLLRALKIYRVLKSVEERIESQHISIIFKIVKLLSSIILMCHLIACAWYCIGYEASKSTRSWLEEYAVVGRTVAYKYTSSFHWALTQFTPASIAIQPTNVYERSFAIVTLLCAMIMFSLFVSGITDALLDLRTLGNFKAKQFWLLRKYLSECNVPKEVSLRVQVYCGYAYENRMRYVQEDTVNLLEMLSTPLRAELRTAIFEPRMAQHPLFVLINKVAPLTMQMLCMDAVSRVMLAHGDVLFQCGQLASQMYFVSAGKLSYEVSHEEDREQENGSESDSDDASFTGTESHHTHDHRLTVGSWVSEAVLWVEWTYLGSLCAQTECDLVSLDAEKFQKAVHSNVNTRAEAALYAKGFVSGLNRVDKSSVTDLFQSGLLEGLWFRLLNEFNVKRRARPGVQSNSMLFNAKVASAIAAMFSKSQGDGCDE